MNKNILYEYSIKETIGKGSFSKVKLGINKSTGEKVAIKILEKRKIKNKNDKIRIERELSILKKINHINIVKIIQTKEDQDNIYIIMEFINYDLYLHIVNNKRLDEKESSLYFFQLIQGLEYIHSLNIVHRDLKPENLLLTKDRILKIIDFGLSNYSKGEELLITPCGSPSYTPPEMIKGYKYNGFAVDIWSTGIILYGMLCGYLPFEERDNKVLFKKIIKCKVNYPKFISPNALNLLKKILVANPDKRITIKEIKNTPFYLEGKKFFYKRYPELIEKLEGKNNSTPQSNYNTNNIKTTNFSISGKKETDNDNTKKEEEKDTSYSTFSRHLKYKKIGPNFNLLKKILRGSRINSSEKELKAINSDRDREGKENINMEDDYKKEYSNDSSAQQVEISNRQILDNKEQMSDRDKRNLYKHKFLNFKNGGNEININIFKNSYNIYSTYVNSEINRKYIYEESPHKINTFNINSNQNFNNYSQKYDNPQKNNKINEFFIGNNSKEKYNRDKLYKHKNTVEDEEKEKSLFSLNGNYYNDNIIFKPIKNTKTQHKNNYSINYDLPNDEFFNSFYDNKNNSSSIIKSYIFNESKSSKKKKLEVNNNKKDKKTNSPYGPKYSGLSKKIININNLYNTIQSKFESHREQQERISNFENNINNNKVEQNILRTQSSLEKLKDNNKNETNKKKNNCKSEEHRKKKLNKIIKNNNMKYSPSYLKEKMKSLKISNNMSEINVRNIKMNSKKINKVKFINNRISQKFKSNNKNINSHINKNNKNINNNDKYNIKEIIKRRGLDKTNK